MSQTLDNWSQYIDEYRANLATEETELNNYLNESGHTADEKAAKSEHYAAQKLYLQQLEQHYAELQDAEAHGQPLPATVDFGFSGAGLIYKTGQSEGAIHSVVQGSGSGSGGDSNYTFYTLAKSQDFDVQFQASKNNSGYLRLGSFTATSGDRYAIGTTAKYTESQYADIAQVTDGSAYLSSYQSFFLGTYDSYIGTVSITKETITDSDIPIVEHGMFVTRFTNKYTNTNDVFSNLHNIGAGHKFTYANSSVPTETPWNYYNNTMKPTIPHDDRVFPDGYNPDPEKPDAEFPELPGEGENGGPDIEPNDITGIGGGFGFLTQYAIRAQDIEILGKLLWAGFRTGSQQDIDKYLMNFVYNVNADTGSMNFSDIMEFFVSLKMYPFPLGNTAILTPHDHHIHIGAGYTAIGDNPNLPHFPNIIYTMDSYIGKISAGSVDLPFWFRDYRDYSVHITLYLPYCGTVELNPGDVMGGTLDCDYYIDFCTGSCTAYVTCTSWDGHKFPVATMPGQIGADVPMSATNAGRIAARIYSDRIAYVENMVGTLKAVTTGAGAIMSGNFAGAARQGFVAFIDPAINEEKMKAGQMERGAIAAPVLSAGGGFTSFCNPATAYVTYRSPFYPDIGNYPDSVGTPATEQVIINNCTGFCKFVNVDVSGIVAENQAKELIIAALAAGIFI